MIDFTPFAANHLSTYNINEFDLDDNTMLNAIEQEIQGAFNNLNKDKTKRARCSYFKIKDTLPDDFEEYFLQLTDQIQIICGIRHLSLDPTKPFIHFESNIFLSKDEIIGLYRKHLATKFNKFEPTFIRYYNKEELPDTMARSVYLIQTASQIKSVPAFPKETDLKLTLPSDDSYFEWYQNGYQSFHNQFPDLQTFVPVNTKDDMEQSRKEGLLFLAEYQGKLVGLISAIKDQFLGHEGIYFLEIFLDQSVKGQGLAKCLQRKFVATVAKDEIIWGTIDFENQPSLKTALSTGRKPVRYEHFIEI